MIRVFGGGGGYPGVTTDGGVPAGLDVAGTIVANVFGARDKTQVSGFDGGLSASGQGASIGADFGNNPLEARYTDGSSIARIALRVDDAGAVVAFNVFRLHAQFQTNQAAAHALGAYSGNAVPVYAEDGTTLLGYVPLYA